MPLTNNMAVSEDTMDHFLDSPHFTPLPPCAGNSSSSMPQSDLSGFQCNIGKSCLHDMFTDTYYDQALQKGSGLRPSHFLPSPPPTNSDPKHSVPLPRFDFSTDSGPSCLPGQHFGGVLDSPVVMKHVALGCQAPISPPPTIPTPTLALPATDNDVPTIPEHEDYDSSLLVHSSPSRLPDRDGAVHQLLSPLSPEWGTNRISSEMPSLPTFDSSILLHEMSLDSPGPFQYPGSPDHDSLHSRPHLSLLDIPDLQYSQHPWDQSPSSAMDIDLDDELEALSTPISPPSSPLTKKVALEPFMYEDNFHCPFISYPPSPSIPKFLHELDDIPKSPSSPSLRPFSSLPQMDFDEDEDEDTPMPSPPSSPARSLLTLPGADPDDELVIDPDHVMNGPDQPDILVSPYSTSLLLLDDPNDVPPPRSPSPENFYIDPALVEGCADPEVQRLCELRKKSLNAERAARMLENQMLEQGAVHQCWEAKRARKREKERSREIGAMLRLKLGASAKVMEGGGGDMASLEGEGGDSEKQKERHGKKKKSGINSMEQLVAKMMLRRNDTYRSLANRKTPFASRIYASSPLTRCAVLSDESEVDADDEESDADPEPRRCGIEREVAQEEIWSPPSWRKTPPEHRLI